MAEVATTTNPSRRRFLATAPLAAAFAGSLAADVVLYGALDTARQLRADVTRLSALTDDVAASQQGRAVDLADEDRLAECLDAYEGALTAVCEARPNTMPGLRAKLEWLAANAEDLTADLVATFASASLAAF